MSILLNYLFDKNPYDNFSHEDFALDLTGFCLPTSVLNQVETRLPKHIVEIGTWKGRSAIYMADLLKKTTADFEIVCIDTWLGAQEMWKKSMRQGERYDGLKLRYGYPTLYYQFIANVIKCGYQNNIVPLPNTSAIGARLLKDINYQADFIFIDGSHDHEDVLGDLKNYWPLLSSDGIMVGDDYDWVRSAINEFIVSINYQHQLKTYPDGGWSIEKTEI